MSRGRSSGAWLGCEPRWDNDGAWCARLENVMSKSVILLIIMMSGAVYAAPSIDDVDELMNASPPPKLKLPSQKTNTVCVQQTCNRLRAFAVVVFGETIWGFEDNPNMSDTCQNTCGAGSFCPALFQSEFNSIANAVRDYCVNHLHLPDDSDVELYCESQAAVTMSQVHCQGGAGGGGGGGAGGEQ